jgi:hypothetical protein
LQQIRAVSDTGSQGKKTEDIGKHGHHDGRNRRRAAKTTLAGLE